MIAVSDQALSCLLKSLLVTLLVPVFVQSAENVDFLNDVKPLLEQQCSQCHNGDESNGGIDFSDPSTVFGAADSGNPAVSRGEPERSGLLERIESSDPDLRMPPEGDSLTRAQIKVLRDWITAGAKWPAVTPRAASKPEKSDHWSFQPVAHPIPPSVADVRWSETAIDRFIQAKRESAGLGVVDDATAEALIRRATYALTGLPPTWAEVEQFVGAVDRSEDLPGEFANLVERLLSRPSYGERWGRHWMDWVRYADTAGDNSDFPIPQAYLYRNYIIDSINEDVPYDRFLTEQLAGDLLPADTQTEKNRQTVATGYLAMARRFGSLVETYPWHLTIEDTIDNIGRTMMGLTLACARCHDHKFDPISTRDYYGLYGIFESTNYAFPGIELFQVQRDLVPLMSPQEVDAILGEHQAKTDALTSELAERLAECRARELENAVKEPKSTVAQQRKMHDELQSMLLRARKAGTKLADHLKELPAIPAAYAVQEGVPTDARIQIKGEPTRPGAQVPRKFPELLGGYRVENGQQSGRLELAGWIASSKNPLTARVIVNRVWQRHFGHGLVGSTSDFGLRGQSPTHPMLLDWLASDFMLSGWSLKHLHRTIMNSRTYRLASMGSGKQVLAAATRDPENKLYWKFNRQRLDAESIRDTLLFLAGTLDTAPQREPYPIPQQKQWKYTQHHPFKGEYPSNKRSVYQMTKRLTAESYMQTFDGPDPNVCTSNRDQSVTALQALFFVNDEFLHAQADVIADRYASLQQDAVNVQRLFMEVLGRRPSDGETQLLQQHLGQVRLHLLAQSEASERLDQLAWASLARSLFRLNEFLYID